MDLKISLVYMFVLSYCSIFYLSVNNGYNQKRTKGYNSLSDKQNHQYHETEESKISRKTRCMSSNWSFRNTTHKKAPITFMPPGDQLLMPQSYKIEICDTTKANLRVLFFLSRISQSEQRNAIRNTYGAFDKYLNDSSLDGNWSLFFLVGKPSGQVERSNMEKEAEQFGDVIVANVSEGYYRTTYKLLVAIKVVSCFCPNAEYVIKADDDTYLVMKKFDKMITFHQQMVDKGTVDSASHHISNSVISEGHRNFYTGAVCGDKYQPLKKGPQLVKKTEFSDEFYPFFCFGPFNIFTMQSVHKLAIDCPHHCIGRKAEDYEENKSKTCFHKFEDVFIGSCVAITQHDETVLSYIDEKLGVYLGTTREMGKILPPENHLAVHWNKKPEQMRKTHEFYLRRNLLY